MWDEGLSLHAIYIDWRMSAVMDVPFAHCTPSMLLANTFKDGKKGQSHIYVMVNNFTSLTALSVGTTVFAENFVVTIQKYCTAYGHTDIVISNLSSDLNSKLFVKLVQLMCMRHTFSIADRHAYCSECTIEEVVGHLRAIAYNSRIDDAFDVP